MRDWIIRQLGGFTTLDSYLETISETERQTVLTRATEKLFHTIPAEDILRVTPDGKWWAGDRQLMLEEIQTLKQDGAAFRKSTLFRILDREIAAQTRKQMHAAVTLQQLETAKVLQFAWDAVKTRLNQL